MKIISYTLLALTTVSAATSNDTNTSPIFGGLKKPVTSWMLQREANAPKYEAIDTILDLEGLVEAPQRTARTDELLLQEREALIPQADKIKAKVYARFNLPPGTHERLNKLHFKRFRALYLMKDQELTLFKIRQTLGFCLDSDVIAAFEDYLIRTHLQAEINELSPSKAMDCTKMKTVQLIAIRNALKSKESESVINQKSTSLQNSTNSLKTETFKSELKELKAKVAGGQPISFFVLSALEALVILFAVLLCVTRIGKDETVSKADQEIVFSHA